MILLIDVGNTRLKWAWLKGSRLSEQQAAVHRGVRRGKWAAALFDPDNAASRVLICNVAGAAMAKTLADSSRRRFGVKPEFVTSSRRFGPLTNGYAKPNLLGADRWLAIVGAWIRVRSALCVIDAGTAVKADGVDASGRHLGGLIVPGIQLMREALLNKTSDIARSARSSAPSKKGILANNTVGAVSRGAEFALAGFADHAADVLERALGIKPKLLITGGDAEIVAANMRRHGEVVPDLVLQGLAAVATER
jgi:type III pantothenate kinase